MGTVINDDRFARKLDQRDTGELAMLELVPRADWSKMSDSEHFVQFYESDAFLLNSLSSFVGSGLDGGEACIVVATKAHRDGLEEQLQARGLDLVSARSSGQFVSLDAAETLSKFMVEGSPEPERFVQIIGNIVGRAAEGRSHVRIFGEMVALLWADGNYDAAIRLEGLWNSLSATHSFSLFCGYPVDGFCEGALAEPLREVCAEHSRVIPSESYSALASPDDRLRAVILWQQKARLLEAEVVERKDAEDRLRASEIRYRRLFEASKDGILIVDPATCKISDANPSITELLGFMHEELLGKELWEIGLLKDREANLEAFRELNRERVIRCDHLPLQTKDGQRRDVEFISTIYQANGHRVIQCNIRDITERKQAEDALRAVKDELEVQVEDLRRLHEMSVSLTSTLDIESLLHEVLQAALTLQGTDLGHLSLCDSERDGLHIEVHSGFDEELLKQAEWIAPGAGATGTCYEQRRRVLVEDVEVDPIFARYRDAARVAGFRACHSTPLITGSCNFIGVLSVHFRHVHRPSEREICLMDLYARMAADIIENARLHRQVQRELEEREKLLVSEQILRAEAESANRMKDEFLATVSHELRTPLNAILGWSHMLRTKRLDPDGQARALETIERNAKSQAKLVEDILDVSRVITGALRINIGPVDVTSIINAAMDSVQLAADSKGIQMEVTLDPLARHVSGDSNRLQQVVWNLLSNAIKFTPSGGRIEVRVKREGSNVQIHVSDTGQGINADFLPCIFDRFRQEDSTSTRRHGGLGLGLAIVRHLVELHGGTVHAESRGEGHGATFTIRLPLATVNERARSRRRGIEIVQRDDDTDAALEPLISLDGLRVLLVDDDPDCLQVLTVMLTERRANVQAAASAAEALEVLEWFAPDVLVSDLAMPGEDGYSLISKIRALEGESGNQPLAVALTAYARVEDRTRALSAGFDIFVPKPVEPNELVAAIANLTDPEALGIRSV